MPYDAWFDSDENRTLTAVCIRKLIRNIGIGGIIWGIINIGIGVVAIQLTLINAGILILGIIMLLTGIQALRQHSLSVLLAETVAAVLLLAWNLSVAVLNGMAGGIFDPGDIIVPLVIAMACGNYYRKLGPLRAVIESVEAEKINAVKMMCKALLKKKLKKEPLIIQTANRKCRARLSDGGAYFIQRDLMRAFVVTRDAVHTAIEKREAKRWTAVFNHPLGKLRYRFDKKNTDKLKNWLAAEDPAAGQA